MIDDASNGVMAVRGLLVLLCGGKGLLKLFFGDGLLYDT